MKFVRLRLQGFKSFVDPTELVIAPGLTGVVGPNGCGKSNLLEALRWAMGETSAKAMRGDGMEDVIFAGAGGRPARAFAEVALTLDNAERRAPLAFNAHDRIEVSRRIAREAGSAYRVNGREARARDVRMLFADAATGAHSPALVRQGRIAELIAAKPVARRAILEEAAGVSGLHQRRHEALLKLDAAARNLERVDEVLTGLEQRAAQLARQAKQAERYRRVSAALRQAELALLLLRWREADAARAAAEAALTQACAQAAQAAGAASAAQRDRLAAAEAAPPAREEAMVAAAVLQRVGVERDQLAARAASAESAARDAAARLAQLRADAERETQLDRDAADSIARLDAECAELDRADQGHEARLDAAEQEARGAEAALGRCEAARERTADEAARSAAERDAAERRRAESAQAADRAARAEAEARARRDQLRRTRETETARAAEAARAALEAAERARAAEAECSEAETARATAQQAEDTARARAATASAEAEALRAERASLERVLARASGDDAGVIAQVRAAPGWEAALGAALGDDLAAPLAQGDGGGWLALETLADAACPDGAEALAPHVAAPEALARRLARVAVVADRASGDALQGALAPGWRLVSQAGDLWRWDGLRRRAGQGVDAAAERLAQQNRLDAARDALAQAEARATQAAAALAEARAAREAAARRDEAARAARREADAAAAEAARAEAAAQATAQQAADRITTLEEACAARSQERAQAEAAQADAQAALAALGDPEAARAAAEAARAQLEAARGAAFKTRAEADELRRRAAGRARRREAALRERDAWARRLEAARARSDAFAARIAAAAQAVEEAQAAPAAIAADQARLARAMRDAESRHRAAEDARAACEARLREAEGAAREADAAASTAREARGRREALLEAEQTRAAEALARLAEAEPGGPDAAIAAIEGAPPLLDAAAAETEIARLRRQREALGAVNLRAEEDARETETERASLAAERADLEDAIGKLRQGVSELNREGRARLLAAFDDVNRIFGELFRHLFGGGEANLALIESDDPLEAGLEIMAMPPGKKLGALSLLSGGEQTLTALALIFAVFLVNPAPICVLDEVDAPLDDANVGRFCDLLDEMTRRTETRFLIITHNAVTMSRMDRLFGVTMIEQGVSQLVSVDLALAAEMAG